MNEPSGQSLVSDSHVGSAAEVPRRLGNRAVELILPTLVICAIVLVLPFVVPSFVQSIVTKMMIFALFGVSMNILWGHTGMPTFGHAAYFGLGGYVAGVLTVHVGLMDFWLLLVIAALFAAAMAAVLGVPALRVFPVGSADNPIYFLLVTLAFGELLARGAIALRPLTGGSTGLSGIPYPTLGFPIDITPRVYYYVVFFVTVVCLFVIYRIYNSHYGYALRGIHDNERRMQALGYNTWLYKYSAYIVAGLFGGVAGAMFAFFGGVMTPNNLGMIQTDIVFLIVILGSASVYIGPIVGSVVVIGLEYIASLYLADRWPLIMGAIIVFVIMALPQGLGVMVLNVWRRLIRGAA